jgi:hypothetical protein
MLSGELFLKAELNKKIGLTTSKKRPGAPVIEILFNFRMDGNDPSVISKSENKVETENYFIEDLLEIDEVKTECLSDEEIIDLNVKKEVKTDIDDFETKKYDSQIIGEKRKNNELSEIKTKKFIEEFLVSQPNINPTDEETDDEVFNYQLSYFSSNLKPTILMKRNFRVT